MQKLRLKVKSIEPNGAVILVAEQTSVTERISRSTGKVLTEKQAAKASAKDFKLAQKQVHPIVRLQIVPMETDKTSYNEGDVFELSMNKTK